MKVRNPRGADIPINMVGSTNFGRYPKISAEQTYNMIISDDFLVSYAGYRKVISIAPKGTGRQIFASTRLDKMVSIIDNGVYTIDSTLVHSRVGSLDTFDGDVFIAENNNSQIGICDKSNIYIYDYGVNTFTKVSTDFIPGYINFQDGYFIASVVGQPKWRLSDFNNGHSWPASAGNVGTFETKADNVVAAFRFPSKGALLFVMGQIVTEPWVDLGTSPFPYSRSNQYNIDYGCLNAATIAFSDEFVVWAGTNEKSGLVILLSDGGTPRQISNEGFNFRFSQLNHPEISYGFLFKQDGHLIYQLTFPHPSDNLSLAYDFSTQKFFTLTDPNMNFHIAKRVVYFNNTYYFVSFIDGNIYELSTKYSDQDGKEMQTIRIPKTIRFPDQGIYRINNLSFWIEQGCSDTPQTVDLSYSIDGGQTFGNIVRKTLNPIGKRRNRFIFWSLGRANEFVPKIRFCGLARTVVGDGILSIYQ